ncbi:hypothetical protein ACWGJW_32935, partial [Streptomyces nigrescens]
SPSPAAPAIATPTAARTASGWTTSEIVWQAEFQPSGIPAAGAEGVVAGVFDSGLHNLASLIAKETAPAG